MNLSKIYSIQADLLSSFIVEIQTDISRKGLGSFKIVGLPDKAIEESKERVSSAVFNSGFSNIKTIKVTVSFSPASLKKEGPNFDLAIALGYLLAGKEIDFVPEKKIFLGELALDGSLKKISSVLPLVKKVLDFGFTSIYLPEENVHEASFISGINIFPVKNLKQLTEHLSQEREEKKDRLKIIPPYYRDKKTDKKRENIIDFSEIKGQEEVKRALEIAAAGGHNISMYGPPGTGKTMMSKAFCGILPKLSEKESLEVSEIYSSCGLLNDTLIEIPPFRSPHHTASYVSVIGGGANPKPGEVTLAHKGVLFLDEFVEFDKRVLESLREPLEDNFVNISRAKRSVRFPAEFILIAALNPPSEVFRGKDNITFAEKMRFQKKLSGPIIDRIDLWVSVPKIDSEILDKKTNSEGSEKIRKRVEKAREIQKRRYKEEKLNSIISSKEIEKFLKIEDEAKKILKEATEKMDFSPRVYHKLLKVAQTIADLDNTENIKTKHILEALQYRPKEII